jgi:hypothetical protein
MGLRRQLAEWKLMAKKKLKKLTATKMVKMMSRNNIGTVKTTSKVPSKKKKLLEEARWKDMADGCE